MKRETLRLDVLGRLYDEAVGGLPLLGTPDEAAHRVRTGCQTIAEGADRLGDRYTALCGAAGFAFGLPGYASMPVTVPSNVLAVATLQLHLAAAVAALHGRDPRDPEVRALCVRCVEGGADATWGDEAPGLGGRFVQKLGERGVRYLAERAARWAGRRAGRGGRGLPLVGGVVGAMADGSSTRSVLSRAGSLFAADG